MHRISSFVLLCNLLLGGECIYNVLCFRQQALFHVLAAYSMYNTEVGYCQGMSQIAALLLMYLDEEVVIQTETLCRQYNTIQHKVCI